jgi:glycosyltransferase involved in cell wall biosynthesis
VPLRGLSRELDGFAPELVHVVSPTPTAVWAQRWAKRRGVPVVSSFHTHFVSYFRYYGLSWLEPSGWRLLRRFYARCHRVYAPTRRIMEELASHGIVNLELWSRGIDLARQRPEVGVVNLGEIQEGWSPFLFDPLQRVAPGEVEVVRDQARRADLEGFGGLHLVQMRPPAR